MKSVLFFLLVCGSLLTVLYFVVEKEGYQPPPAPEIEAPEETEPADDTGNKITIPKYDNEEGRLVYKLEGNLETQIPDLKDPDHLVLTRGKLHIPIYNDRLLASSPENPDGPPARPRSDADPVFFIFEFDRAEYFANQDKTRSDEGTFEFSEGGRGTSEDGTEITFEKLTVTLDREYYETISGDPVPRPRGEGSDLEFKSRKVFRLSTSLPVTIRHPLFQIHGKNGIRSQLQERDKLQRIIFNPPVTALFDPRAAQIFGFDLPVSTRSGKGGKLGEGSRVAITCDGPLVLDKTRSPGAITFEDDVYIYPTLKSVQGERPERGDTWFYCQKLELVMRDPALRGERDSRLPPISEAVATWPGDRVRARYEGVQLDGESLVWKVIPGVKSPESRRSWKSEAVLQGRPNFVDESRGFSFTALESRLLLDERKVVFRDGVEGKIRVPRELLEKAEKAEKPDESDPSGRDPEKWRIGLPDELGFQADEVEIAFDRQDSKTSGDPDARPVGAPTTADAAREKLDGIDRFVARSESEDGLVIRGTRDKRFQLQGKTLTYEAGPGHVLLEGGRTIPPQFSHTSSTGTAKNIILFLERDVLRFEDEVSLNLNLEELQELGGKERRSSSDEDPGMLRILSEVIDVNFLVPRQEDGDLEIFSAAANTRGNRPVTLIPLRRDPAGADVGPGQVEEESYRIEGPHLVWTREDHKVRMKARQIDGTGSGKLALPRLSFRGGDLRAHDLEFDRRNWLVWLREGVVITSYGDPSASDRVARGPVGPGDETRNRDAMQIACDRARVDFFEEFRPLAPGEYDDENLKRIEKIEAWGRGEEPIEITREDYSARARRVTWSSETRQLHLFGPGRQEFTRGKSDTLVAEDITYTHQGSKGEIRLLRNVEGKILLENKGTNGSRRKTAEPLEWHFTCPTLTVGVEREATSGELQLVGLEVQEKVFLECKQEGIQLHGDDLSYDHAEKVIRIYSRHGRYQTLLRTRKTPSPTGGTQVTTDKIDAREVRVWYLADPAPLGRGARSNAQIVVKFERDVIATFYAPESLASLVPASSSANARERLEQWKLRANELLLRVQRSPEARPLFPYAYAEGEVDFSSGKNRAMAQEAHFNQDRERLILRGDARRPVRLYYEGETLEGTEIELKKTGSTFKLIRRQ